MIQGARRLTRRLHILFTRITKYACEHDVENQICSLLRVGEQFLSRDAKEGVMCVVRDMGDLKRHFARDMTLTVKSVLWTSLVT